MSLLIIHGRKGMLNAANYGLHPAGDTDDSAAMLAAMQAAVAQRRKLWIPAGTYLLSSALTLPEGVEVVGPGDTAWLKGQVKSAPHTTLRDLKVGFAQAGNYMGFGINDTHSMLCSGVTFTGGGTMGSTGSAIIGYWGVDYYDVEYWDCIIEGDIENTDQNGITVVNYGQADERVHDVVWHNSIIRNCGRMGAEYLQRQESVGQGSHPLDYPYYNMSFHGVLFKNMGYIALSYGDQRSNDPNAANGGDGVGEGGNSIVDGCTFSDAGLVTPSHVLEMAGVKGMTVTNNTFVGSHFKNMISQTNGDGELWSDDSWAAGNTISGNTLDGHLAASCSVWLSSGCLFDDNTVICRDGGAGFVVDNTTTTVIINNSISMHADDAGTLSTSKPAMYVKRGHSIAASGNHFYSKNNPGTVYWGWPAGYEVGVAPNPACTSTGNTYHKASGNTAVYVQATSVVTRTDDTTYVDV
jgi:hypothetical protein